MAQNRSLDEVLKAVVAGIAECRNIVLARIWLLDKGDLCESCRFRADCADQSSCLHLVASAGNSLNNHNGVDRLDGGFRRFPLGHRKIGEVAKSGQPMLLAGLVGNESWIADPDWFQRESIRSFAAQPLIFRGVVLGVLAIFDRGVLSEGDFEWLRVFADHAAVSIANAQAFEEIAYLKERLEEENDYLRQEVKEVVGGTDLIGGSEGIRKVLEQIQLVAPTDAAVLVSGESGTGKELIARAIHDQSQRAGRSLIKVNCGAVPESLFESEFFGHVKGAFTGAVKDRAGRFELADGGTLFLDEIGEVPLAMQAKLLRVLQEGEFERVGEARTQKVDVRIVAATNRDLREEVRQGRFRQDLYYRLSVFPLEIPALRDRMEDVEPLVLFFMRQIAQRMRRATPRISKGQLRQLTRYEWPGNVRELENAVERAVILSSGGPIHFDLPISNPAPTPSDRTIASRPERILTKEELKQREFDNILVALGEANGKVFGSGGAAELLNMKPTTLASRMKALGIRKNAAGSRQY